MGLQVNLLLLYKKNKIPNDAVINILTYAVGLPEVPIAMVTNGSPHSVLAYNFTKAGRASLLGKLISMRLKPKSRK